MLNKIQLIGRLGQDPELKYTTTGKTYCNITIATSKNFKQGEEWKEKTEWHRVTVWNKKAEYINQYFKKGFLVFAEGEISYRSYDDKDGKKVYITEITAYEIKNLNNKIEKPNSSSHIDEVQFITPASEIIDESDIPF